MDSTAQRKIDELKNLNKTAREQGYVVQSPFYNDETNNPCIKEQNLSARCSLENDSDKTICKDYAENYVLCVKFWNMVKMRRRFNGEYPALPPPELREAVKKFYIDEFKTVAYKVMARQKKLMGIAD